MGLSPRCRSPWAGVSALLYGASLVLVWSSCTLVRLNPGRRALKGARCGAFDEPCEEDSECCRVCYQGFCGCLPNGDFCNEHDDCCSRLCMSSDGIGPKWCMCIPENLGCTADAECCVYLGLKCQGGICVKTA
ncbi:hypothetical protein CHLNCDRAFT_54346 [Chlorella variabilis]|uniref:Uncharacterized protein n=1 Tax=Chlorella variabilis TaxID=554065 RepID=E1ZNJ3_CHLVA|nr:hypothetical protein CHLNCDRAFT_54346 [Chlorella variabilis]EFN52693.1 hypothetical protein CHLNCDRAFT_54346 [Chlorella variabilis]|eukprot:XP_005844795.1 hypothetical protein CHLNCDRAFT_54346 [Chlorella variabilis]